MRLKNELNPTSKTLSSIAKSLKKFPQGIQKRFDELGIKGTDTLGWYLWLTALQKLQVVIQNNGDYLKPVKAIKFEKEAYRHNFKGIGINGKVNFRRCRLSFEN